MAEVRSVERRLLVAALALLGLIPVVTGLAGVVLGPTFGPGGASVPVDLDSEYRFVSVPWVATGLVLWWSLVRVEERAPATRCVLVVLIAGGLARLLSLVVVGPPMALFAAALVIELAVVPALLWWHARVLGLADRRRRGGGLPGTADR